MMRHFADVSAPRPLWRYSLVPHMTAEHSPRSEPPILADINAGLGRVDPRGTAGELDALMIRPAVFAQAGGMWLHQSRWDHRPALSPSR